MVALGITLAVVGFVVAVVGGVLSYRGRMREEPMGSGMYTVPDGGLASLVLIIVGAVVALAGALVGILGQA